MLRITVLTWSVFTLILLTVLSVLGYHHLMNKELVIAPGMNFEARAITDSANGGQSFAELKTTDSTWEVHYRLHPGAPYPYTTLTLLPPQNQGLLDLSTYDSIIVKAYLTDNSNPKGRIRIQLRNINPAYTVPGQLVTLKYNELQYSPITTPSPARFIWGDFRIPSWWLDMVPVPYELARTEVNCITRVDITTPESAGEGILVVQSISFRGKHIPSTLFYQSLLGAWLAFALIVLVVRAWHFSDTLKEKDRREKELIAVKEALEIRTNKLEDMAQTDPLTGLLNRFGLHSHLKNALDQVGRSPQSGLSVIIADIDFFKKVNDTQGHAQGDIVLKQVAQVFQRHTRNNDSVVRWGGEEFLILSPMAKMDIAARVAEKLRFLIEKEVPGVTCSFGVSEWKQGRSITEVIQKADTALYRSKRNGRNQVQCEA